MVCAVNITLPPLSTLTPEICQAIFALNHKQHLLVTKYIYKAGCALQYLKSEG
jgi:hypothetical protein